MAKRGHAPTIADIARAAGVSTSAVSYALNGKAGVGAARRQRILEVAEALHYRPNASAQALARSQARAFGLVVNRPAEVVESDRFFPAFMAGAQSVLSAEGYTLSLDILVDNSELEHYARLVTSGQVSGFFVTDLLIDDPRLTYLAEHEVPAVLAGEARPGLPFPGVTLNEDDALREIVDELVGLGHTRIAVVSGPQPMVHARRRHATVLDALEGHGLKPSAVLEGDFGAQSGASATTQLLARRHRPTAILFGNDQMAIGGAATARAMGYSLPDELSMVGIDDIDLAGFMHPSLTTISSRWFEQGARSAGVLLSGEQDGATHEIGRAELVRRDSIAPPPAP